MKLEKSIVEEGLLHAKRQAKVGQVLVLCPDQESCNQVSRALGGCVTQHRIFVRSAKTESSLKSITVKTLIVLGSDYDIHGLTLARERMRGVPDPVEIFVNGEQISPEDARHIYYVYRAMHDGSCPNCGHTDTSFHRLDGGMVCPSCAFTITKAEAHGIEGLVPTVLKVRVEAFKRCCHLL